MEDKLKKGFNNGGVRWDVSKSSKGARGRAQQLRASLLLERTPV